MSIDDIFPPEDGPSNDPLDYMSKEEADSLERDAWTFELDKTPPKAIEVDWDNPGINIHGEIVDLDAYEAYERSKLRAEQEAEAEIDLIVDEKTLEAAVEKWFGADDKLAVPVVEGLLFRGTIAAVYGESHSGKTLAAMALSDCVSRGVAFGDLRVRKGPVVYLNSESVGDFNKRYKAQCEAAGIAEIENFRAMHGAFDVRDPMERAKLLGVLPMLFGDNHRPPVFVFDTLAQHLSGVPGEAIDENSAKDMGRFIYGLRSLAEKTDGVVLLVAHSGKDGDKGIRGSSALRAALDSEIRVKGHKFQGKRLIEMNTTKQRMCDRLDPACYVIRPILLKSLSVKTDVGIDDDDVLIDLPPRTPEQFTRSVAPSNQSAVMEVEPMPVPSKADEDDAPSNKTLKPTELTQAENVQRILADYFQGGRASRKDVRERWLDEGLKSNNYPKAVSDAIAKGLIVDLGNGILSLAAKSTVNGNLGSSRDVPASNSFHDDDNQQF